MNVKITIGNIVADCENLEDAIQYLNNLKIKNDLEKIKKQNKEEDEIDYITLTKNILKKHFKGIDVDTLELRKQDNSDLYDLYIECYTYADESNIQIFSYDLKNKIEKINDGVIFSLEIPSGYDDEKKVIITSENLDLSENNKTNFELFQTSILNSY